MCVKIKWHDVHSISYTVCMDDHQCMFCAQVSSTEHPCVVFGPDEYDHIYNDALAKNMTLFSDQESKSGKIYKLLRKMLDDAGQVLDLIIVVVNHDNQ